MPAASPLLLCALLGGPAHAGPGAEIVIDAIAIDDDSIVSDGDGDGQVESGETIELSLDAANIGDDVAPDVEALLSTSHPSILVTDPDVFIGTLDPGEVDGFLATASDFDFRVDASCKADYVVSFDVEFRDSLGRSWVDSFDIDVGCVGQPEVEAVSVEASSDIGEQWDPVDISFTLSNSGTDPAGPMDVVVYWSTNTTITSLDDEGCRTSVTVDPGSTSSWTLPCNVALAPPGAYYVGIDADAVDVVDETDEGDNTVVAPDMFTVLKGSGAADLVFHSYLVDDDASSSDGDADGIPEVGEAIELSVDVENLGSFPALELNAFLSSSDPEIAITDADIPFDDVFPGEVGGSIDSVNDFDLRIDPACAADFDASLDLRVVDSTGTEHHDSFLLPISCPPTLDLDVVSVLATDHVGRAGDPIAVDVELSNGGTGDSGDFDLSLLLSSDDILDAADPEICRSTEISLAGGSSRSLRLDCTLPDLPAGSYTLGVVADPDDLLDELDEANNSGSDPSPFTLSETAPELVLFSLSADDTLPGSIADGDGALESGERAGVELVVDNLGDADATAVVATLSTGDPLASFIDPSSALGDLPMGDRVAASDVGDHPTLEIDPSCTADFDLEIQVEISAEGGLLFTDSALLPIRCVRDEDGDGFDNIDECDDADPTVYPGADEWCNGVDDDCDGETDEEEAVDAPLWFTDADGDGFGADPTGVPACDRPDGLVGTGADCDDSDPDIYPGATELCDGADQDCDGVDDDGAIDAPTLHVDQDGDGYGDPLSTVEQCEPGDGAVKDASDCDDGDPDIHPGADEVCNEADDDCDGAVDDFAIDAEVYYLDSDGDGYGVATETVAACSEPEGYADNADDCDDRDVTAYPGAPGWTTRCIPEEEGEDPFASDTAGQSKPSGCSALPVGMLSSWPLLLLLGAARRRLGSTRAPTPRE